MFRASRRESDRSGSGDRQLTISGIESIGAAVLAQLPGLRRFAVALTGSPLTADDLVQDCIERALRRSETLHDSDRLGAWLRTILRNLYLDELRRTRSRGTGVNLAELENDIAISIHPEENMMTSDLSRALASLSVEHREILLMVGLEGLSYREIAAELGIEMGTVMSRLARAREKLRRALEAMERSSATVVSFPARRMER